MAQADEISIVSVAVAGVSLPWLRFSFHPRPKFTNSRGLELSELQY